MTRRVALAILATVWTMLIVGGLVAYFVTRSLLLAELDASLRARALSLPVLMGSAGADGAAPAAPLPLHAEDRYLVENDLGQTIARSAADVHSPDGVQVRSAGFVRLTDGRRRRRITLVATAAPAADPGSVPAPVTVVFSGSADGFDRVLNRLAATLLLAGAVSGGAAAWVAARVSRAALRPLRSTAEAIGAIDERSLHRRVDTAALPPELQPVGQRLNDMLARLEQSVGRRRQFVADASHELRTPVAALLTTLEVALRRPRDEATLRQALRDCLGDARLLRELVERLIEQVRSEQLTREDLVEETDVAELIDECAGVARRLAEPRDVRVDSDRPAPLCRRTQPERLRSVLLNLLSNAVEHTPAGGRVWVECDVFADGSLTLVVRDTGRGIAREHLPHVFEAFYRADHARTHGGGEMGEYANGHLGLGLYLVRSHVQAMGGRVDVRSEVGVGSTFTVTLPPERQPDVSAEVSPATVGQVTAPGGTG